MSQRKLRVLGTFTCAISVLLVGAGRADEKDRIELKALGLTYQFRELKEPRPNRVHILRVDCSTGKITPAVVVGKDPDGDGPAETALTNPLKLAGGPSVLAFINTNPWDSFPDKDGRKNRRWYEGQPVDISGVAVSRWPGKESSPGERDICMGRSPGAGTDGQGPGYRQEKGRRSGSGSRRRGHGRVPTDRQGRGGCSRRGRSGASPDGHRCRSQWNGDVGWSLSMVVRTSSAKE